MRKLGVFGLVLSLCVMLAFAVLRWLDVPAGSLVDWIVGIASFWWLLAIVTIPWDLYFQARELLYQAGESRRRAIELPADRVSWATKVARRSLALALALHGGSALGFVAAAAYELTPVGYVCGALAALLTLLRPGWRAFEYVQRRLGQITKEIHVPREDAVTLRDDIDAVWRRVSTLERALDESDPSSFAALCERRLDRIEQDHEALDEATQAMALRNEQEHQQLAHQAEHAVRKLSEDAQFWSTCANSSGSCAKPSRERMMARIGTARAPPSIATTPKA